VSYFAFGLLSLEDAAPAKLDRLAEAAQRCARSAGLTVRLRGEGEPAILQDMRGAFSADSELAFFCVANAEDDTSEALISPFTLGMHGAERGLAAIADWVRCLAAEPSTRCVQLWLTEGWDDAFELVECTPQDLPALLTRRLQEEADIPSLHVSIATHVAAGA